MRIVDRREAIENRIANFLATYRRYSQTNPMMWTKGVPLGYYVDRVANLDPKTCSPLAFGEATNNPGIVENPCDECGGNFERLIRFGEEPDYEARWQDLCAECLSKAIIDLG